MTERPIIFSGPMVRAILAGKKTQTRRMVRLPRPRPMLPGQVGTIRLYRPDECPYGQPGDRLWVREAHRFEAIVCHGCDDADGCDCGTTRVRYAADAVAIDRTYTDWEPPPGPLRTTARSPIHMPRWASRLTLEVADVRIQRLHDLSEEDVRAEGIEHHPAALAMMSGMWTWRGAFSAAWDAIHGAGAWDANPWVWAVTFRVVP
jgi:hypothetical protein